MPTIANPPTTVKISVREIIGKDFAGSPLLAEKVYARVAEAFTQPERKIVLNFSNIRLVTGPFMMACVGALYERYTPEEIDLRLSFDGLSEHDFLLMKDVQQDARWYYTDKEGYIQCYQEVFDECGF